MCKTIILIYDHFIEDMNSTTKKKRKEQTNEVHLREYSYTHGN